MIINSVYCKFIRVINGFLLSSTTINQCYQPILKTPLLRILLHRAVDCSDTLHVVCDVAGVWAGHRAGHPRETQPGVYIQKVWKMAIEIVTPPMKMVTYDSRYLPIENGDL